MDHRSAADSRFTRSASLADSASMSVVCSRWKPTESRKGILESLFASGLKKPSVEQVHGITADLQVYGSVEGKNVFYRFKNANARDKRKRERAETSSSKWPAVFKPRSWTHLFRSKRSHDMKSSGQMEEEKEEVASGRRRYSSVDPSQIRTMELFPLRPEK